MRFPLLNIHFWGGLLLFVLDSYVSNAKKIKNFDKTELDGVRRKFLSQKQKLNNHYHLQHPHRPPPPHSPFFRKSSITSLDNQHPSPNVVWDRKQKTKNHYHLQHPPPPHSPNFHKSRIMSLVNQHPRRPYRIVERKHIKVSPEKFRASTGHDLKSPLQELLTSPTPNLPYCPYFHPNGYTMLQRIVLTLSCPLTPMPT